MKSTPLNVIRPILLAISLLCDGNTFVQAQDREPKAVIELGTAAAWDLNGGKSSVGPAFAVEATPIENRLEIEAGVTPFFHHHSTEWNTDFLLKKPWTLSSRTEFMLGVGPAWTYRTGSGVTRNSLGVEIAPDFMFWRSARHRLGWYVEPSYEYDFAGGHEQSVSISIGLLVGVH
jgi:hypothetical protein